MAEAIGFSTFSTSLIDPRLRSTSCRKVLQTYSNVSFTEDASAQASIIAYSITNLTIALSKSGPAHHMRDRDVIARSDVSHCVLVQLILDGDIYVRFGDKSAALSSGDIFFVDLSMDCEAWIDHCECVHLLIPKSYLHKVIRLAHGRTIQKNSLVGRVLSDHFIRCADLLRKGDSGAARAAQATVDLMLQCLTEAPARDAESESLTASRRHILEYIDMALAQPHLDATFLATRFTISRAKLYRIFSEFGGVQQFIRNRRLDAVLRDLCEQPRLSINEAAHRYGFSNDRQFQRAFRAKFGMTARDARMAWQFDHLIRHGRT